MRGLSITACLLLVTAVTVIDARHGCTTCPNNACNQDEAHIGFCNDETYVTEGYQCSYSGSAARYRTSYYSCGWFGWSRCGRTVTYYQSVTLYQTCYRARLVCQRRCCNGFQLSNGNCNPYCTGGCHNGGVCIDPEVCECPSNWQGQYCDVDVNECESNNGGCSDYCSNNPGSYSCHCREYSDLDPDGRHCTCRPGFIQNDATLTCDDIDECADNNGGCDHDCTNTPGSHICQCDPGYELHADLRMCLPICTGGCLNGGECVLPETCDCATGWTGQNCETDIDECAEGISGCQQHCTNTVPGYTCSCDAGYTLNVDGHACDDINECDTNNGGCDHLCHNTIGSFYCSCRPGYTLQEDGFTCVAQPCPTLYVPLHGGMSCTGEQVTDETCHFTCDPGYELLGSDERFCQPNNTWTGQLTICNILHCPELQGNDDTFIVYPCETAFGSSCRLQCTPGYYYPDPNSNMITCEAGPEHETVVWTERPMCEEILPCQPNPCLHGGYCNELDDGLFFCLCDETGYKGDLCQIGVVDIYPQRIPVLRFEESFNITVSAKPDRELIADLTVAIGWGITITPPQITFDTDTTSHQVTITAEDEVVTYISVALSGLDYRQYETPADVNVVVQFESSSPEYANNRNLDSGILEPSCCRNQELKYQCLTNDYTVRITSTCKAEDNKASVTLPGISFVAGNGLDLPLSLDTVNVDYSYNVERAVSSNPTCLKCDELSSQSLFESFSALRCSSANSGNPRCYCYRLSAADVSEMLAYEGLAKTYLQSLSPIVPDWLVITPLSSERVHHHDSYHTSLVTVDKVADNLFCPNFLQDRMGRGIHSLLTYRGDVELEISQATARVHNANGHFCVAVDMCEGSDSPVHISLPEGLRLEDDPFFQQWRDHGWQPYFGGAALSLSTLLPVVERYRNNLWNSNNDITVSLDPPQMSLNGNLTGLWQVNEDTVELSMHGEFDLHVTSVEELLASGLDQDIQVVLPEAATLTITTTESSTLYLTAVNKGYMSLNSSEDVCTSSRMIMMRMVHSYPEEEDDLLSQILVIQPQSIGGQLEYSCQVDMALGLSATADVTGLAMRSPCHDITFNELVFSGFTNILAVGRSGSPAFCGTDYIPNANIELHLWAGSSSNLQMNAFVSLVSSAGQPVATATLDPASSSYQVTIPQAQISALEAVFTAPVQIDTEELMFIAFTNIFQQTPANLVGTAQVDKSWEEMQLRLQGRVEKYSELHNRIELQTRNLLSDLASRADDRIEFAEVSLDSIKHQLALVEGYYNGAAADLQAAETRCAQFDSQISNTEAAIAQLEQDIGASGAAAELQESLNEVCELRSCGDVCTPGTTCSMCSVPVETEVTERCPATCTRTKQVRMFTGYEYFTDYTTRVSCGGGGAWVTCIPLLVDPTAFTAGLCFVGFFLFGSKCSTYRVPIQGRRDRFENVLVEEHYACTMPCTQISTSYIMQECCVMDDCASLVPDTTCVKENAICQLGRRVLLDGMSSTVGSPAYQIQQLDENHSSLTVLRAQKARCKVEERLAREMADQLLRTFNRLNASVDLGERHLAEIKAIHMVGQELNKLINFFYDINSIFNVTSIDFDITASVTNGFTSIVPLRVSYEIPYLNRPEEVVSLFEFDFFDSSIHTSSEEMSRAVQDILTEGASTRRRRRLAPSEDLDIEEYWKVQCDNLYEMRGVVEYMLETLYTSRNTHLASLENATIVQNTLGEIAANLSDMTNVSSFFNATVVDGVELTEVAIANIAEQLSDANAVQAVNAALSEVSSAAGELVAMTAESAFLQWQLEISNQLNATVSVHGHDCAGFLDCIITITEVVKSTLEVPQIPESNRLLELLPDAEQDFVKLAFRIDLTLEEAIASMKKIVHIVNSAIDLDYWCATLPSVQLDQASDAILRSNESFQLECNATSPWPLNYEWQTDNVTLPGATRRELVIDSLQLSDAGEYRCIASNHIGSVVSVSVGLTVVTPPAVVSHPTNFSTYPQSGDQVVLDCDVSGSPPPVISWYWRPPGSQEAMVLPNATATELRYPQPEPHLEGWYYCEGANREGVMPSRQAYVHILNSSVVQFAVPAVVSFSREETGRQRRTTATTALDTGIDPLLHTTLDEDNSELTDMLTQLIQEHVDLDGVTLLKASTDNPASPSSISFLVATEVVPINSDHTTPLAELFDNFTTTKDQLRMAVEQLNLLLAVLNYTSLGVMSDETEYSGVDLTTAIWRCPPGQGLNTTNFLFCVECLPGEYPAPTTELMGGSVLYAYPTCTECPRGHYQSVDGQPHCDPCPLGHHQPSTGQTTCEACAAGYYQMQTGQDYCLQCPEGTVTEGIGATACREPPTIPATTEAPHSEVPAQATFNVVMVASIGAAAAVAVLLAIIVVVILLVCCCTRRQVANKRYREEMLGLTESIAWEYGDTPSDSNLSAGDSHVDETSLSRRSSPPQTEWNAARNSLPNKALEDLDLDAVMLYDFAYSAEDPDYYRYTLNVPDKETGLTFVNERAAAAWPHFDDDDRDEMVDSSTNAVENAEEEGDVGGSGDGEEGEDNTSDEEESENGSSSDAGSGDESQEGDEAEESSGGSFESDEDDSDLKPLVPDHSPHEPSVEKQSAPAQRTEPAPRFSTASDEDMLV